MNEQTLERVKLKAEFNALRVLRVIEFVRDHPGPTTIKDLERITVDALLEIEGRAKARGVDLRG
jgi:hypothetical protein